MADAPAVAPMVQIRQNKFPLTQLPAQLQLKLSIMMFHPISIESDN